MPYRHSTLLAGALLLAAFTATRHCKAETVELSSGQRIDGVLTGITATDVLMDAAGQHLSLPREKVSAIYFGAARPIPAKASTKPDLPVSEALGILKGVRSATGSGVTYRTYAPRVTDAKARLDRLLGSFSASPESAELVEAMSLYIYASEAWGAHVSRSHYENVGANPLFDSCAPLKTLVDPLVKQAAGGALSSTANRGLVISTQGITAIFGCASDRIDRAEQAIHGS